MQEARPAKRQRATFLNIIRAPSPNQFTSFQAPETQS